MFLPLAGLCLLLGSPEGAALCIAFAMFSDDE